jgi:hypothetical protein
VHRSALSDAPPRVRARNRCATARPAGSRRGARRKGRAPRPAVLPAPCKRTNRGARREHQRRGNVKPEKPRKLAERWQCSRSSVLRIARRAGLTRLCLGVGKNGIVRYIRGVEAVVDAGCGNDILGEGIRGRPARSKR